MTSTTLSWEHVGRAEPRSGAAISAPNLYGNGTAARWLGRGLLAAVVAALMTAVGPMVSGQTDGGGVLTWLALWAVGFLALLVCAQAMFALAASVLRAWSRERERAAIARVQREIRIAAGNDPRILQELQVMRDRAERDHLYMYMMQ